MAAGQAASLIVTGNVPDMYEEGHWEGKKQTTTSCFSRHGHRSLPHFLLRGLEELNIWSQEHQKVMGG